MNESSVVGTFILLENGGFYDYVIHPTGTNVDDPSNDVAFIIMIEMNK